MSTFAANDDRLTIEVPRDSERSDISIFVEVSSSLLANDWTVLASSITGAPFSGPGYFDGDSIAPGFKLVTIRDSQPVSAASARFIRIRITH